MNKSLKQMKMLIVAVAVAFAPLYAEVEVAPVDIMAIEIQEETNENSSAWYNKASVQAVMLVAATTALVYTVAVQKNKVSSPISLLTALFAARSQAKNTTTKKTSEVEEVVTNAVEVTKEVSIATADDQDRGITNNWGALINSVIKNARSINFVETFKNKIEAFKATEDEYNAFEVNNI